jgi:hypothetical protein
MLRCLMQRRTVMALKKKASCIHLETCINCSWMSATRSVVFIWAY